MTFIARRELQAPNHTVINANYLLFLLTYQSSPAGSHTMSQRFILNESDSCSISLVVIKDCKSLPPRRRTKPSFETIPTGTLRDGVQRLSADRQGVSAKGRGLREWF